MVWFNCITAFDTILDDAASGAPRRLPFMRARTMQGRDVDLTQDMLGALARRLRGPVLIPNAPGYADALRRAREARP